ncbi:hypothetical protein CBER1_01297 [Cercospora berteroae]|uniref:Amino acid permease/ SLC12A domain-containing protein n=1 Tax=Cercospora berteroae TaxID=357750 RepID=A0A2S6CKQ9_9PEZI|nr:hypothetical protein CBER1_01297 [Cercospora berteroae]
MSQPMPHSMPVYPQTAPMSVPFTQEVPDLNVSMLPNETNMDLFMMNSDVTTWTDVQPPWTAAACEPDHCCLNTALDLLRQLSITEASKACPRRGMPEQIPPPTLEMAATMNRTIIASLNTILGCSCSLNGNLLTIISLVTFKLIAWCASAAKNTPRADSPMSTAETMGSNAPIALKDLLRSPPAGLDGLMDAVGATGNEQIQAAAQTVLDDLYRVQDLVNLFSQRLNMARRRRSAVGGGSAVSDIQAAMYNTSTTLSESVSAQLESDLRRRLRAVSFETVQILLRGSAQAVASPHSRGYRYNGEDSTMEIGLRGPGRNASNFPYMIMPNDKKDPQTATPEQGNDLELTLMLAIGGVIGPEYFVGMGNGLSSTGPAGLLICFGIVGTLLHAVMQSVGELGAFVPVAGSFTHYTHRLIDPCWAFALGWNYWLLWAGIIMAEYNNLGLVLTFWDTAMPRWGWIMVFWVIFMAFTFLGVKSFGEAEFWLASIKVLFIVIFFICAILISTGVIGGEKIGFKFYRDAGPFADGVKGVCKIFVFAALQYSGTEMVGLIAGESANPGKDVPKAVKSVVWRIVVIFLGGIFFLAITVPFNDPNLLNAANKTARSPFVIAFTRVGVNAGAHAVNAVIVITILSAVNAALYAGSRTLYSLAVEK